MMSAPNVANAELLYLSLGSAVLSTNVLANVCKGNRCGSDSRACKAASFGEDKDATTGGEGSSSKGLDGAGGGTELDA